MGWFLRNPGGMANEEPMNKDEKHCFVTNLCDSVRDHVLSKLPQVPEEWDGHELRELIADAFAHETSLRRARGTAGLRRYRSRRPIL